MWMENVLLWAERKLWQVGGWTQDCSIHIIAKLQLMQSLNLSHWGRDKMATILQTMFSNAFSWNKNVWILLKISLKFAPKGQINNIPSLVQIMAWHWLGNKPLSEPMMISLLTHICVAWPQWVNWQLHFTFNGFVMYIGVYCSGLTFPASKLCAMLIKTEAI